MNLLKRFQAGGVLFRQGDPSDHVVVVRSGSVDVLREVGSDSVLLGTAKEGEFVGEMGVLEGRPRSATVRAATDLEVELIGRQGFLERVSREPELAHKLLLRMSSRLRDVEDMLTRLHVAVEGDDYARRAASEARLPSIALSAATYAAKFYLGLDPIKVTHLPFVVGRAPGPHEATVGATKPDLEIPEPEPYRLSRSHFCLLIDDGAVLARDLASELGTIVNQTPLGRDFAQDTAPLHPGENQVVAGGTGSPFTFTLTLG